MVITFAGWWTDVRWKGTELLSKARCMESECNLALGNLQAAAQNAEAAFTTLETGACACGGDDSAAESLRDSAFPVQKAASQLLLTRVALCEEEGWLATGKPRVVTAASTCGGAPAGGRGKARRGGRAERKQSAKAGGRGENLRRHLMLLAAAFRGARQVPLLLRSAARLSSLSLCVVPFHPAELLHLIPKGGRFWMRFFRSRLRPSLS